MDMFHNHLKQYRWLSLLPLLFLTLFMGTAQAAPNASFSAQSSGTNANLNLSVHVNVADGDLGKTGNYYIGINFENSWYFFNGSNWRSYKGGKAPAHANGSLANKNIVLAQGMDLSALIGAKIYVGYGLTQSDMVANGKFSLVYTVTEDIVVVPPPVIPPVTPPQAMGPSAVLLGTASNFVVLAKSAISTVPPSAITGDVGVSPAATSFLTGFSLTQVGTTSATSPQVTGNLFGADMTAPTSTRLTTAVLDMETAYTDAAGRSTPDFLNLGSGDIGGETLTAGLYKWGSSVTMPTDLSISGGADDVWIFQMSGDLVMSANTTITLTGGAQAKNIFWQVAGQVSIGADAHFEGIILSKTAITLQTGATMNGRALAQTMVALESATVTSP